jgi:hypothetical protein
LPHRSYIALCMPQTGNSRSWNCTVVLVLLAQRESSRQPWRVATGRAWHGSKRPANQLVRGHARPRLVEALGPPSVAPSWLGSRSECDATSALRRAAAAKGPPPS